MQTVSNIRTGQSSGQWNTWTNVSRRSRVAVAYQYLNTAVKSTDVGISPELIVKAEVPEDYDCLGVGIDLSAGLRENDWTVFTLGGIKDGKIYWLTNVAHAH